MPNFETSLVEETLDLYAIISIYLRITRANKAVRGRGDRSCQGGAQQTDDLQHKCWYILNAMTNCLLYESSLTVEPKLFPCWWKKRRKLGLEF